jgi:hypothetical protein
MVLKPHGKYEIKILSVSGLKISRNGFFIEANRLRVIKQNHSRCGVTSDKTQLI